MLVEKLGGRLPILWSVAFWNRTSWLPIAWVSTLPELIRSPLARKALSAGGVSRAPLSKPVQSDLLPK